MGLYGVYNTHHEYNDDCKYVVNILHIQVVQMYYIYLFYANVLLVQYTELGLCCRSLFSPIANTVMP